MPQKKTKITTTRVATSTPKRQETTKVSIAQFPWANSYTSLLLGIIVVIAAVILVIGFLKGRQHGPYGMNTTPATTQKIAIQQESKPVAVKQNTKIVQKNNALRIEVVTPVPVKQTTPYVNAKTYTVKHGDDLWKISENAYGTGYNWTDIARANNLTNPSVIHSGNVLVIPNVRPKVIAQAQTTKQTVKPSVLAQTTHMVQNQNFQTINGTTYIVKKGDTLWDIANRSYANPYKWTQIAQANQLANPSMIFSGNVLKIPR